MYAYLQAHISIHKRKNWPGIVASSVRTTLTTDFLLPVDRLPSLEMLLWLVFRVFRLLCSTWTKTIQLNPQMLLKQIKSQELRWPTYPSYLWNLVLLTFVVSGLNLFPQDPNSHNPLLQHHQRFSLQMRMSHHNFLFTRLSNILTYSIYL